MKVFVELIDSSLQVLKDKIYSDVYMAKATLGRILVGCKIQKTSF